MKFVWTTWEVWEYDVVGNRQEGYTVNDRFTISREYRMKVRVKTYFVGTPREFQSAFPTDRQLKQALGIKPRVRIATAGDDEGIYVEHASSGYPFGELMLVSPHSLKRASSGSP